jgi:hypothetical protein
MERFQMRRLTVFALLALNALTLSAVTVMASDFTGTWKANEAKSKVGSNINFDLEFRRSAKGELQELRGPASRPVVQPVVFDGKPYKVDGGNMIEWKQIDDHDFERKIFEARTSPDKQGRLITTRNLQISPDEKTLTEKTERTLTDGKPSLTTITYTRSSGEPQGLVGAWKRSTLHSNRPPVLKLEPAGNALKVSSDRGLTYTLTLDGKDAPVVGADVVTKTTVAGKQVNNHTIEVAVSREGVLASKSTWELSPDGKTMTVTTASVGPDASREPSIDVYERQ